MVHANLLNPNKKATSWPIFFLGIVQLGPKALQLQEAALNITMELNHETNAADVVFQFVLVLGNGATL